MDSFSEDNHVRCSLLGVLLAKFHVRNETDENLCSPIFLFITSSSREWMFAGGNKLTFEPGEIVRFSPTLR
jgi:hypothetical protein